MAGMARVALVTGGGQGIGKAIAARFLQAGWAVLIADVDGAAAEKAVSEMAGRGTVACVTGDLACAGEIERIFSFLAERFGRLDALVNNAGISIRKPLDELSLDEWNRVLAVNLTAAFLCARRASPLLRHAGGAIVNIASTRAHMSEPDMEAYAASKGGLVALTHSLSVSLGPGVRVNCISPGWIDVSGWSKEGAARQEALRPEDHAQHPAGRVGRPEDVAELAWFLSGPQSGFVTGGEFVVDGGMTRKMIYV